MEKIVFWKATAMVGLMALPIAGRAQSADVAYEETLRVEAVSKAVKLPEHIVPLCVIVIGHPAESPTPKDKWKPENVSYNEYGER